MKEYHQLLRLVLEKGKPRADRTGVGTLSVFGAQARFDLSEAFPLLTTKRIHFRSVAYELLWFVRGQTNVRFLHEHGVTIWDEWANQDGDLGRIYGAQWTDWRGPNGRSINQLEEVIDQIRTNPTSRRLIVTAWNPGEVSDMALPPCHALFQFYVLDGQLSCQLYQRSADLFLGVPFNIASYALLTAMIARLCNLQPAEFILSFGDLHVYQNHLEQVRQQLEREPRSLPQLRLRRTPATLAEFEYEDFELCDYHPYPGIKAPIAV